MNFLDNNCNKKQNKLNSFLAKFSSKKANCLDLGYDVFSVGKRWKFSKYIFSLLVLAVVFQFAFFVAPILAAEAVEKAIEPEDNDKIVLENGVILSELETELLNRSLVVKQEDIDNSIMQDSIIIGEENIKIERKPVIVTSLSMDDLKNVEFIDWGVRTITSYNSEVGQCDDSPCITANMFNVCEHGIEDTVAANFLKFGTKIRIPDLFGNRIFVVRDRMNKRYPDRLDVWMVNKSDSREFGVKRARIEVITEKDIIN